MRGLLWHLSLVACLVVALPMGARGDLKVVPHFDGQEGLTLYQLTVTAAAEPDPALKHRLQLRPLEYKPGNAATYYLRANAESYLSRSWQGVRKQFGEAVDQWYTDAIPLADLPLDDLRRAASSFDSIVANYVVPASQRQDCDWGYNLTELRGSEVYSLLLPGAQQSRSISRLLALRTRLAIAEGRFEDAIDHMRMNYRLATNVGREPLLVCGLVGIAEARQTNDTVLDFIAAAGSPNLYWALTELPRPLIELRNATSFEMSVFNQVFSVLQDAESAEHSPAEWARLFASELKVAEELSLSLASSTSIGRAVGNPALVRSLTAMGLATGAYPGAKQRLIDSGMEPQQVDQMPVGQVLAIDTAREYRRLADEAEKWWYVSFPAARHRMAQVGDHLRRDLQTGFAPFVARTLPAVRAGRMAEQRLEWQMNALRVIEALRMHAAETGQLASSLDQVRVVPVPLNPVTNAPYVYYRQGEKAVLELPFSDGMRGTAWRFEITLAE